VATFCMMGLVVLDVGLRTFRIGCIPSGVEIVALSVVLIVYLPAAALQQKREHLRVMVLSAYVPERIKALIDFISWFLFLIVFAIFLWKGWEMAVHSWKVKEIMIMSSLPIYPVRFLLVLGCFLMVIQLILDLRSTWRQMTKGSTKTTSSSSEE
jgi:TRAP-type C4-dicarboxylate transport system permease small subunit